MWLFCHVVTLFTNTAWRKCGIIFSLLALFAPSLFVICPRFGRKLTWKLQLHLCQNLIKIKWFGSFAMTAVKNQRYSSMLWLRNAWTANLITRAKHGAEQVAMARPLQWNWQWQWQLQVCLKLNASHIQGFLFTVSVTRVIFIGRENCGPPLVVLILLSAGISHNWSCPAARSLPEDPSWSTCNPLLSYAFVPP